ncbi:hypothetical protein KCP75_21865 [Salmonella enterica subsp. enterica]|nr:hypothetical protein KCP75_21865 [Salmonella enterica subsp. enterica]
MIRFKYGLPEVTVSVSSPYTSAILSKPAASGRGTEKTVGVILWMSFRHLL